MKGDGKVIIVPLIWGGGPFFFHRLKQLIQQFADRRTGFENRTDLGAAAEKGGVFLFANGTLAQKTVHVKNQAFVDTVVRDTAVDYAGVDDRRISRFQAMGFPIDSQGETSA